MKQSERGQRFNDLDKILKQISKHTTDDANVDSRLYSLETAAEKSENKIAETMKNYQRDRQKLRTREGKRDLSNSVIRDNYQNPLKEIQEEKSKKSKKPDQVKKEIKVFGYPIKHINSEKG